MLKIGPSLTLQDFIWWLIAIVLVLSIASVGVAIHATRTCAPLVRWVSGIRADNAPPEN